MTSPSTAREALIAEALGETAKLIRQMEALQQGMAGSRQALVDAHAQLTDQLAAFEAQVTALTEKAKVETVKYILARTDETARRSMEQQKRAMSEAARVAFGAELGPILQRLLSTVQPMMQRPNRPWERWLTHAAAATAGSAVTWMVAVLPWAR